METGFRLPRYQRNARETSGDWHDHRGNGFHAVAADPEKYLSEMERKDYPNN
jgi:hypothetical protein